MRKLVIIFFVLINLTGFTLALLEGSNFLKGKDFSLNNPSEIRMLTVSAFGGSSGIYIGYIISKKDSLIGNRGFSMALMLLIGQNLIVLLIAIKAFKKKKRATNYNRSSLSLK